jgi:RHS repeat-associated protein
VEVNGSTVIGPVSNTAFTSGNAGVWSYAPTSAGSHRFDNFSVTVLGGGSSTSSEQGVYRKVKVLAMTDARRRAAVIAPPANTTYRMYYYAGGRPIAMRVMPPGDATGTVHYLLSDHLGSMSASLVDTSSVTRQYFYAFGGVRASTGTLPTAKGFTGQYADSSTGLMFFNARYYSGLIGRFISADTLVPDMGNPQALNRYAFVFNNPLRYVDPSGHVPCDPKKAKLCPTQAPKRPQTPNPNSCPTLIPCQPPANPQLEAEGEYEFETSPVTSVGPGISMATGKTKGGSLRAKVGQKLIGILSGLGSTGMAAAEWIRRVVCGGDCSDEAQNIATTIQSGRVSPFTPAETEGLRQLFGKSDEGARALLQKLSDGQLIALPKNVTVDTLVKYREIAQNAISQGKDALGVQAMRLEAIDRILSQISGGHP